MIFSIEIWQAIPTELKLALSTFHEFTPFTPHNHHLTWRAHLCEKYLVEIRICVCVINLWDFVKIKEPGLMRLARQLPSCPTQLAFYVVTAAQIRQVTNVLAFVIRTCDVLLISSYISSSKSLVGLSKILLPKDHLQLIHWVPFLTFFLMTF